jgi:hypothetical protein
MFVYDRFGSPLAQCTTQTLVRFQFFYLCSESSDKSLGGTAHAATWPASSAMKQAASSSCWFIDSTIKQVNFVEAWAPCASLFHSHSSLALYDPPPVWRQCINAITPRIYAACTLHTLCFRSLILLCSLPIPLLFCSLPFFK